MQVTGITALKLSVEILGSEIEVAKIVCVTPQAVSECVRFGKRVPAEWCIPIEHATKAKGRVVTRHQLRPDLYPLPPTQACAQQRAPDGEQA